MLSCVIDMGVAATLAASTLGLYQAYLKDSAIHNLNELVRQQEMWIDMDLTQPSHTYLSKLNLGFTAVVDPIQLNAQMMAAMTNEFALDTDGRANFYRFLWSSVPAINNTKFLQVVVHVGDIDVSNLDVRLTIQSSMDRILVYSLVNLSACRVELVFKGSQVGQDTLNTILYEDLIGKNDDTK